MNRPDTDAQDQLLQIITFGLQRAAGPYRWASKWTSAALQFVLVVHSAVASN